MANPLLALQVQPANIDVAGSLGRGQELRTMTLNNALNAYRLKQSQAAYERSNALARLYGEIGPGLASGDDAAINRLAMADPTAAQGFKKGALELDKAKADIGKVNSDTLKAELDIAFKRSEFVSNGAQALLQTPAAARPLVYERLKQFAGEQGGGIQLPDTLPSFDDATLKAIAGQAISAKDQIAAAQKAAADAEAARHNKASEGLTRRGQDMTDARAREARDIQIAGQKLTQAKTAADLQDRSVAKEGAVASYDTALATLGRLKQHPGKGEAVGAGWEKTARGLLTAIPGVDASGYMPGTDRAGFKAELDAFKSQTFLPMVQNLRGMGALSDAEGKKLSDAVGALSEDMSEAEFDASIDRIEKDLTAAKNRVKGAVIDYNDLPE